MFMTTGDNRVANILFGTQGVDANYYIGVYTSPASSVPLSATMASITEPSTARGYARVVLANNSWLITNGQAAYSSVVSFSCTGTAWGNTYGYFVTTTSAGTAGVLMCAETFNGTVYSINPGDTIAITPTITVA